MNPNHFQLWSQLHFPNFALFWVHSNTTEKEVNCIKYIFYITITIPIWCPKYIMMPWSANQIQHCWVTMDIQVIHCKTKQLARIVDCYMLDNPLKKWIKSKQSCSFSRQQFIPIFVVIFKPWNCHRKIGLLVSIVDPPSSQCIIVGVLCLF